MFLVAQNATDEEVMTGYKIIPLPTISASSDFGLQYGIMAFLYNYGDGARYPDHYDQYLLQLMRYTSGSGDYSLELESFRLIPNIRFQGKIRYATDEAVSFFGLYGKLSTYNPSWTNIESDDYQSRMFYNISKKRFSASTMFEGYLPDKRFKWNSSLNISYQEVGGVDIDKVNSRKSVKNKLPSRDSVPDLFTIYKDKLGLIAEEETKGWANYINANFSYDTRDIRQNPTSGMWSEIGFRYAPKFLGSSVSFSRISLTHRQYFSTANKRLTMAYRLSYEQKLTGEYPFFYSVHAGAGGSSSVRGVLYSKINGEGFGYGNLELRWKTFNFKIKGITRYIGLNAFYDVGVVTKGFDLPDDLRQTFADNVPQYGYDDLFCPGNERLFQCAGGGISISYNPSVVLVVNFGKSFYANDGNTGFCISIGHLF